MILKIFRNRVLEKTENGFKKLKNKTKISLFICTKFAAQNFAMLL